MEYSKENPLLHVHLRVIHVLKSYLNIFLCLQLRFP